MKAKTKIIAACLAFALLGASSFPQPETASDVDTIILPKQGSGIPADIIIPFKPRNGKGKKEIYSAETDPTGDRLQKLRSDPNLKEGKPRKRGRFWKDMREALEFFKDLGEAVLEIFMGKKDEKD